MAVDSILALIQSFGLGRFVQRFGVTAACIQAGLRSAGFGLGGAVAFGLICSDLWGASALTLGRQYQRMKGYLSEVVVKP